MKKQLFIIVLFIFPFLSVGQTTQYNAFFDYKNINTQTFIPMTGWNTEQKYLLTILKHSFEMQQIISQPKDTTFLWNGLTGKKTIYTKDSLILFFIRPADTITRPCVLITHGNDAQYRSSWHEQTKFFAIDLAMRGYCVAFYENPSSREATQIRNAKNDPSNLILLKTKNGLYNGFQSAVAANLFLNHNASALKIDTTRLFAGGYSYGAYCSLALASADAGQNFTDSIFSTQGNFGAKSVYNDIYTKNIKRVFSIGGALPKDDTLPVFNSKMGNFLDEKDAGLSLLFLHGRTDNLISFDLTKLTDPDSTQSCFFAEGPSAMTNTIRQKNLSISSKLVVNCRGGHNFSTSVCGYSNPYCMAQWHWLYLKEPPDTLTVTNPYFTNISTDSMLRYAAYMLTQVSDVGYIIADFLQPSVLNTTSTLNNNLYYLQPQDSFKYANANGHYIIRTNDCEGKPYVITTAVSENKITKEELNAYPNPTSNFITFVAKENIENIRIYSILGELVKEINSNNLQERMAVHDLATGEYFAVVQLKNKLLTMKISVVD